MFKQNCDFIVGIVLQYILNNLFLHISRMSHCIQPYSAWVAEPRGPHGP